MKNIFQICLFLILSLPLVAQAQDKVRCESEGGRFHHCRVRIDRSDDVRITDQRSKASCRRGDSWGIDRGGIWVDKGCRADFLIVSDYRRDSYQRDDFGRDRFIGRNNRDYDSRSNGGYYNSRRNEGFYDSRRNNNTRRERRQLAEERRKLEAERREFENRKRRRTRGSCPEGARIGRCTDAQRAKGCKDWKTEDQTPCKSGG